MATGMICNVHSSSNKLGNYKIGDAIVHSKLEAITLHEATNIHPHWDFNESVFSSYNWAVEPAVSIAELYRRRAQQLREQYDYIILMFSGGADSTNVLDTFINNNIKLDEVASYVNYEVTGKKENYLNAEIYKVSIPYVQKIQETCPQLKHTLIDLGKLTTDFFSDIKNRFNWIYEINSFFTPNAVCRESLGLKIPHWANLIDQGKKLCILWAHDKPRILHINNRFVFRFIDCIDNGPTVKSMSGNLPYTDELFYWTPDLPEIVIKQGHLIKNYLDNGDLQTKPFVSQQKSDLAYKESNGCRFWLSNHGVHKLIYPTWDINTFSNGKPSSIVFSPRDDWFISTRNDTVSRYNWEIGVQQLWQHLPDYWKNNPLDPAAGTKQLWSKDYFLS